MVRHQFPDALRVVVVLPLRGDVQEGIDLIPADVGGGAVPLEMLAREDAQVARRRRRALRLAVGEDDRLARQRVEVRRRLALRPVEGEPIGATGVERDQDEVRRDARLRGPQRSRRAQRAGGARPPRPGERRRPGTAGGSTGWQPDREPPGGRGRQAPPAGG